MSELSMSGEHIRDYSISLWDLLDNFIAVLKNPLENILGTILEPIMNIVDDGTRELKFTIPMYIRLDDGILKENPIWYNVINGNLIANMRKLKVIFNMGLTDDDIFEFIIIKVTESHDNKGLNCDIVAEGLAFHELGKLGYKIALEYENFEKIYDEWKKTKEGDEPIANLLFWNEENGLGLLPYPGDGEVINANTWYYDILMDWSSYSHAGDRSTKKVYEEEYTPSWRIENHVAIADAPVRKQEKARIMNVTNSNYYNLTQELAKEFGIFCKYKYKYDDNYHIIGRIVVYYNNFINEQEGVIDFTYPYSSSAVSREMDGTDLITKMYIETIDDSDTVANTINIMGTDANLSKEDYILNFEYMHKIKAINDDLYAEVKLYEVDMGEYNTLIENIDNQLLSYKLELPTIEAAIAMAEAGVASDKEGLNDNMELLKNLDLKDKQADGYILTPMRIMYLLDNNGNYSLKLTDKGVLFSSVEIYENYNFAAALGNDKLNTESNPGTPITDTFNNLISIDNLIWKDKPESNRVYVKYKYSPELYYLRIIDTWNIRLAKDLEALALNKEKLASLKTSVDALETDKNTLLELKKARQLQFARVMGAALREGSWTPDNYKNCENKLTTQDFLSVTPITDDRKSLARLMWDTGLFDKELKSYYELGITQEKVYYPYIELTDDIEEFVKNHMDEFITLIYYDYKETSTNPHQIARTRRIRLNGGLEIAYIKNNEDKPQAVLLITEAKNMSEYELGCLYYKCQLCILNIYEKTTTNELTLITTYELVYDTTIGEEPNKIDTLNDLNLCPTIIHFDGIEPIDTSMDESSEESSGEDTEEEEENLESNELQNEEPLIEEPDDETNDESVLNLPQTYDLLNLRYRIDTLNIKVGEKQLYVHFDDVLLKLYYDFSTLVEDGSYYITIKPNIIFKNSLLSEVVISPTSQGDYVEITYTLSNASTAIYLDSKQVLKENSVPRVSYNITTCLWNKEFMSTAYNKLNRIININDYELKFENVLGYISSINLKLDKPFEDTIEVKNYKTKFEDLFSSIIASTELMQKNTNTYYAVSEVLNPDGTFKGDAILEAITNTNLNYSFNNGALTITNENGIVGKSDGGLVVMRSDGIFTSTNKDMDGNLIWNTAITPQGINAQLITTGLLDTNRVVIYAGDDTKFQLNDLGLYAYRSLLDDKNIGLIEDLVIDEPIDKKQYVVYNANGLFLRMEPGAKIVEEDNGTYELWDWKNSEGNDITEPIDRVEISWNGLVLRNYEGKNVFEADPDTGDLTIRGTLISSGGQIGDWMVGNGGLFRLPKEEELSIITAEITPEGMNLFDILEVGVTLGVIINSNSHRLRAENEYFGFEQINPLTSLLDFDGTNVRVGGQLQLKTGEDVYSNLLSNNKIATDLLPNVTAALNGTDLTLVTTGDKYNWNSKAAGDHTHTTTIAVSQENNLLSLTANTKYVITAGETSYVFTTPPDTTYSVATTSVDGLMSSSDKTRLNGIATGALVNVIESISVDNTALTITNKSVNIDLSGKVSTSALSIIAPAYDEETVYLTNEFCINNNHLYKANTDFAEGEEFDSTHWDETTLVDELSYKADIQLLLMIAPAYDPERVYLLDEYCIYNYHLYKAKDDFSEAEEWDASHWDETTLVEEIDSLR